MKTDFGVVIDVADVPPENLGVQLKLPKVAWNCLKAPENCPSKLPKLAREGPNSLHKQGWVFAHLRQKLGVRVRIFCLGVLGGHGIGT